MNILVISQQLNANISIGSSSSSSSSNNNNNNNNNNNDMQPVTFTEANARRPPLVLGWVTTREDRARRPVSVRRCGPQYVTDRLYSRYRADMDVN